MTPVSAEEGAGDLCAAGECSVPLAPLPLEAIAGVEACAPTPGILKEKVTDTQAIDVRRAAAAKTSASIFAKVCLAGSDELEEATDTLEFYGVDLCPLQFKGSIRPLMGVLEGEMTAALAILYVKGSLLLQYETKTGDKLRLCDGATCSNGANEDCAMCAGDLKAKIEFVIKFLFASFKMTLAEKDVVSKCSTSGVGGSGQCSSGLSTSDTTKWEDGKICGLGTTCNQCANPATYWTGKLFDACGNEPCWEDGTVCGAGTTCEKCCNTARDALGTKCGGAAGKDGTACGLGTTCNLCENPATWWDEQVLHRVRHRAAVGGRRTARPARWAQRATSARTRPPSGPASSSPRAAGTRAGAAAPGAWRGRPATNAATARAGAGANLGISAIKRYSSTVVVRRNPRSERYSMHRRLFASNKTRGGAIVE
jgi:hypothetical protein